MQSRPLITYSADLAAKLDRVNRRVNNDIRYRTDLDKYGRKDHWVENVREGDCEDYALTKRFQLIAAGLDRASIRLATCWVETGEYHAVLLVDTSKGTFCLDNRDRRVKLWNQIAGYKWHLVHTPGEGWNEVGE